MRPLGNEKWEDFLIRKMLYYLLQANIIWIALMVSNITDALAVSYNFVGGKVETSYLSEAAKLPILSDQ